MLTGPAAELVQGCCSYGAHFASEHDVARVTAAAATLDDTQWQHREADCRERLRPHAEGDR